MSEPSASTRGSVIHPRLPDDLKAELVEYARRTDRSLNNAVVHGLRSFLAAERERAAAGSPVHYRAGAVA